MVKAACFLVVKFQRTLVLDPSQIQGCLPGDPAVFPSLPASSHDEVSHVCVLEKNDLAWVCWCLFIIFIYLFVLGCAGFSLLRTDFLNLLRRGGSVHRLLVTVASLVGEHRL